MHLPRRLRHSKATSSISNHQEIVVILQTDIGRNFSLIFSWRPLVRMAILDQRGRSIMEWWIWGRMLLVLCWVHRSWMKISCTGSISWAQSLIGWSRILRCNSSWSMMDLSWVTFMLDMVMLGSRRKLRKELCQTDSKLRPEATTPRETLVHKSRQPSSTPTSLASSQAPKTKSKIQTTMAQPRTCRHCPTILQNPDCLLHSKRKSRMQLMRSMKLSKTRRITYLMKGASIRKLISWKFLKKMKRQMLSSPKAENRGNRRRGCGLIWLRKPVKED